MDKCPDCLTPPGTRCESAPGNCPYVRQGPTPGEIAKRLRALAEGMEQVAAEMDYFGGFAEWAKHGREIAGAGAIARQWAEEIEKQNAGEATPAGDPVLDVADCCISLEEARGVIRRMERKIEDLEDEIKVLRHEV